MIRDQGKSLIQRALSVNISDQRQTLTKWDGHNFLPIIYIFYLINLYHTLHNSSCLTFDKLQHVVGDNLRLWYC